MFTTFIGCFPHNRGLIYLPVGRVMPLEVLNEHLVYAVRSRWVTAGVSHGASTSIEILPHYHRNFPQSRIGSRGTGWYHAVVEELVIQRVRPARRSVLINGHGRIVRKVRVPEHLEHIVSADLRRAETIMYMNSAVNCKSKADFSIEEKFVLSRRISLLHQYV